MFVLRTLGRRVKPPPFQTPVLRRRVRLCGDFFLQTSPNCRITPHNNLKKSAFLALACFAYSLSPNSAFSQPDASETLTTSTPRPVEYAQGRRGLAMSGGYFRGVPLGELAGWSASIWFQTDSQNPGDIFGLVLDRNDDRIVRLQYDAGKLRLVIPHRRPAEKKELPHGRIMETAIADRSLWHQVVITYSQGIGPSLYLDGKLVATGERKWLGYALSFSNYHFGARAFATGEYGGYFDGLIDDFKLYQTSLSAAEVEASFQGEPVGAPLVMFNDFENVDHRDLARFGHTDRDENYIDEGRQLYEINCIACHSKDGISTPPNPLARSFTQQPMGNGSDPYRMFETLTYGYRNMMAAPQLDPAERYKVIHYIREKLIRPNAPGLYTQLPDDYTDIMPENSGDVSQEAERIENLAKVGYLRDYGKALITPVDSDEDAHSSRNALVIDLGNETTLGYDLGTLNSIGAWQGGFLDFSNTLHHKLRASGLPRARFDFLPGIEGWGWAWNGNAAYALPELKPRTISPESQIRYRGHYPFADDTVISYTVQGRSVLESPSAETRDEATVIHRRFTIAAGNHPLELVARHDESTPADITGNQARTGNLTVWLTASSKKAHWRLSADGKLVLHIPPSAEPINLNIAMGPTATPPPKVQLLDLTDRTQGGPRRWTETHTLKGKLATSAFQGYALDSVPVPLKNVFNSWMRTSSLAFFPDGRLAVGTLNGDIWIVSGIDEDLENVTWQRFAAGVYEPLGMKVIDGVLTAGTRGRIVKFHDHNNDGEADFYEAFHNETEPANGWHAYSFDLINDDAGNYYYARVGTFSDWILPGGLVRVSADGKTSTVLSTGMRVPNGIGRLPDGRVTFGDNQGTYVPASKISVANTPDTFHGAGGWEKREGDYEQTAVVDPIVYMPQELDSSSGSQLWVPEDARFGPLGGQYFHTSYGQARSMIVFIDENGDTTQGAIFPLPMKMESGTMRLAQNPIDGQLYYSGLTGWQAGATREGSIQRLRYTGTEGLYLLDAKARQGRLILTFNRPLDAKTLEQAQKWQASMWNYQRTSAYGSPHYKVTDPETEGTDTLSITGSQLSQNGTQLILDVPQLEPCHTLKLDFAVTGQGGTALEGPVYFTIHKLIENGME
jgi:hypothetical protein